ncbi:UNVERIFIED_CONTAM: hypothetical protein Slati_1397400 [Sesamum latifolium]|uniref:Reverse transcriptase domain-containing protein n=1 Tax=Sesamum latifolium TaxID=2727402 RepID=A0AAW2X8B3_9LAMI
MLCMSSVSYSFILSDDTLIFCQASHECTISIKDVLEVYRKVSGQEINFSKSLVAFSRNMIEDLCVFIATKLTIRRENKMELYLGLPSRIARANGNYLPLFGTEFGAKYRGGMRGFGGGTKESIKFIGYLGIGYVRASCWVDWDSSNLQVTKLRDSVSGEWDSRRVPELFWPIDSEFILSIPLCQVGEEDLWVWDYAKNGLFSVRSAYHLACELEDQPRSIRGLAR